MPKSYTLRNFDGRKVKLSEMIRYFFAVYDQYFTWDPIESEGMYVCCGQETLDACMTHQEKYNQSNWQKVPSISFWFFECRCLCETRLLTVAGKQRDANWRIHLGIQPSLVRCWSRLLVGNYSCPNNEGPTDISDGTPQVAWGSMGSGSCLNIAQNCLYFV